MKKQQLLALGLCLALCAFCVHVAAMRPSEEDLCRAEALDYLLAQGDAAAIETLSPYLGGTVELVPGGEPPAECALERVGERMLCTAGRLYYIRPDSGGLVLFLLPER